MSLRNRRANITRTPQDALLLFHGMKIAATVDGAFGPEEGMLVRNFLLTLPEFAEVDFDKMLDESNQLSKRCGGLLESIEALQDLSSEALRNKCLLLALEVAFVSGSVSSIEDELLGTLQRILGVRVELAELMRAVVRIKYE